MRFYNDPFLRFLAESSQVENQKSNCNCTPSTNVMEDKDAYRIEMAIPGFSKEDVKISIEKNLLTISSEKTEEKKDVNYTRREFARYEFRRSFRLPETIDQEQIQAEFRNGILTLTLPKKEEVKLTREITIA